MMLSI
jgi:hypothetical protein